MPEIHDNRIYWSNEGDPSRWGINDPLGTQPETTTLNTNNTEIIRHNVRRRRAAEEVIFNPNYTAIVHPLAYAQLQGLNTDLVMFDEASDFQINPKLEKQTLDAVEHARKISAALVVHTTSDKLRIAKKYKFPIEQIYTPADLKEQPLTLRKWSGVVIDQVDLVIESWLGVPTKGMTLYRG